ncbi:hypothetical protein STRTUCAR8_09895, partial [Streptomyces turgidiscabies Car8]
PSPVRGEERDRKCSGRTHVTVRRQRRWRFPAGLLWNQDRAVEPLSGWIGNI